MKNFLIEIDRLIETYQKESGKDNTPSSIYLEGKWQGLVQAKELYEEHLIILKELVKEYEAKINQLEGRNGGMIMYYKGKIEGMLLNK